MSAKRTNRNEPSAASLKEMPEVRDWSKAIRNPYARGGRVRLLDLDVASAFPDSASVNAALRVLLSLRAVLEGKPRRTKRAA